MSTHCPPQARGRSASSDVTHADAGARCISAPAAFVPYGLVRGHRQREHYPGMTGRRDDGQTGPADPEEPGRSLSCGINYAGRPLIINCLTVTATGATIQKGQRPLWHGPGAVTTDKIVVRDSQAFIMGSFCSVRFDDLPISQQELLSFQTLNKRTSILCIKIVCQESL